MQIAVCDDEVSQNDLIIEYICLWTEQYNEPVEVYSYSSAIEFLYYWSEGKRFDIIFLDINMEKMNGVDLARLLRKSGDTASIVFLTGLKDYVFQGYKVQALDYLLKPIKKRNVSHALTKPIRTGVAEQYLLSLPWVVCC